MKRFSVLPNLLPKSDKRYKKWLKSLKNRPASWSKGYTKETHPSIAKISETFKRKKIDNFAGWRENNIKTQNIPPYFKLNSSLAELYGVILGDGNISKFPRTERLIISANSNNKGFIKRYSDFIQKIFNKKPCVSKIKGKDCTRISIYQKEISRRVDIPLGARGDLEIGIPEWILNNKNYLKGYLRGLYEAEGSFCVHKPTCTYKFLFSNKNKSLLDNVYKGVRILGFHPHRSKYQIQVSRKEEVYKIKKTLEFREY